MTSLGERLVSVILDEEMRWRGYIDLGGLGERLGSYLDATEQLLLLTDAARLGAVPDGGWRGSYSCCRSTGPS
jgi:hypothetical protein